jgi:hypothetical protein
MAMNIKPGPNGSNVTPLHPNRAQKHLRELVTAFRNGKVLYNERKRVGYARAIGETNAKVAAALKRDPRLIMDDLRLFKNLQQIERDHGTDLRDDILSGRFPISKKALEYFVRAPLEDQKAAVAKGPDATREFTTKLRASRDTQIAKRTTKISDLNYQAMLARLESLEEDAASVGLTRQSKKYIEALRRLVKDERTRNQSL